MSRRGHRHQCDSCGVLTLSVSSAPRLRILRHRSHPRVRRQMLSLVVTCCPLAPVVTGCPPAHVVTPFGRVIYMTNFFTHWTSPRMWCSGELDQPDRVRCRLFLEAVDILELGAIKNSVGVTEDLEAIAFRSPLGELLTRLVSSVLRLQMLRHRSCHHVRRPQLRHQLHHRVRDLHQISQSGRELATSVAGGNLVSSSASSPRSSTTSSGVLGTPHDCHVLR